MLSRIPFISSRLVLLDSRLTVVSSAASDGDAIIWLSFDLPSFAGGSTASGELLLRSSHFLVPVVSTFPICGISSYGSGKEQA